MFSLNSVGQRNFDVSIACSTLSAVAVALRIYCKHILKNGVHADDYWMLVTVVAGVAAGGLETWGNVTGGRGREMLEIIYEVLKTENTTTLVNYLVGLHFSWMLYLLAAFSVKISVLVFYRRIFITPIYQRVSLIIIIITVLWFLVSETIALVVCIPLDAFWNRFKHGRCLNANTYVLVAGILDALLDTVIVALPIRMAFTLHLPMRTKVALSGIFLLGSVVVITNFLRVKFMYQPNAIYANYNEALLWSSIHVMTAHVCACLPIYKPLWQSISSSVIKLVRTQLPESTMRNPTQDAENASSEIKLDSVISLEPTLASSTEGGLLAVEIEDGRFDAGLGVWGLRGLDGDL